KICLDQPRLDVEFLGRRNDSAGVDGYRDAQVGKLVGPLNVGVHLFDPRLQLRPLLRHDEDSELVPDQPPGDEAWADLCREPGGNRSEQPIADDMSAQVVDVLETGDVQNDQGSRRFWG